MWVSKQGPCKPAKQQCILWKFRKRWATNAQSSDSCSVLLLWRHVHTIKQLHYQAILPWHRLSLSGVNMLSST